MSWVLLSMLIWSYYYIWIFSYRSWWKCIVLFFTLNMISGNMLETYQEYTTMELMGFLVAIIVLVELTVYSIKLDRK